MRSVFSLFVVAGLALTGYLIAGQPGDKECPLQAAKASGEGSCTKTVAEKGGCCPGTAKTVASMASVQRADEVLKSWKEVPAKLASISENEKAELQAAFQAVTKAHPAAANMKPTMDYLHNGLATLVAMDQACEKLCAAQAGASEQPSCPQAAAAMAAAKQKMGASRALAAKANELMLVAYSAGKEVSCSGKSACGGEAKATLASAEEKSECSKKATLAAGEEKAGCSKTASLASGEEKQGGCAQKAALASGEEKGECSKKAALASAEEKGECSKKATLAAGEEKSGCCAKKATLAASEEKAGCSKTASLASGEEKQGGCAQKAALASGEEKGECSKKAALASGEEKGECSKKATLAAGEEKSDCCAKKAALASAEEKSECSQKATVASAEGVCAKTLTAKANAVTAESGTILARWQTSSIRLASMETADRETAEKAASTAMQRCPMGARMPDTLEATAALLRDAARANAECMAACEKNETLAKSVPAEMRELAEARANLIAALLNVVEKTGGVMRPARQVAMAQ